MISAYGKIQNKIILAIKNLKLRLLFYMLALFDLNIIFIHVYKVKTLMKSQILAEAAMLWIYISDSASADNPGKI